MAANYQLSKLDKNFMITRSKAKVKAHHALFSIDKALLSVVETWLDFYNIIGNFKALDAKNRLYFLS